MAGCKVVGRLLELEDWDAGMRKLVVEPVKSGGPGRQGCGLPPVLKSAMYVVSDVGDSVPSLSRRARIRHSIGCLELVLLESPDIPISLADLANLLHLERTYCCRVIREITGKLFTEWIRDIRMRRARSLLLLPGLSITEISLAVGYTDLTTFSRNFRKESGMSPRTFRQLKLMDGQCASS
jgi:two-component system, response regulator YesN